METCHAVFYKQIHQFSSASPQLPVPANLHHHCRRRRHQNVCRGLNPTMSLRGLALRRITANQNHLRFNNLTQAVGIANHLTSIKMAEESKNKDVVQGKVDSTTLNVSEGKDEKEKDTASEKSMPPIPPPPEKPLPGDCCGSGCVSCVWDLYYDELEEYNRLYKANSNGSRS